MLPSLPRPGTDRPGSDRRSITVPGHGAVLVAPDTATLRLGIVVVRPTASEARRVAAATMEGVIEALRSGGITGPDLQTALVGLDAVRDYSEAGPKVTGYQLTNSVAATIRSIDAAGALIDAALAAGATSMDGLAFRLADPSAALADARRLAMTDARARAQTLAEEAGVQLGEVIAIVEGESVSGPPRPMAEMHLKAMADATTPIESGTSELSVDVAVAFAII